MAKDLRIISNTFERCLICQRILQIKEQKNPYFVTELKSSYVVLGDHQFYRGYTLVLSKTHTTELHLLPKLEHQNFLTEISQVGEAVYNVFKPKKLNYEILGNEEPHLHCHIFPRYDNDLNPNMPIWVVNKEIRTAEKYRPDDLELREMKKILQDELKKINVSDQ